MTQDNTNDERRHFKRIPFDAEAELSSSSGRWRSRLIDLSLHGALVERPTDWVGATGEPCLLHIHLAGNDISIHMEVMATHVECPEGTQYPEGTRPGKIGLRCTHIDIDSIAHLRRFVELNLGDTALLNRELSALVDAHEQ